MAMLKEKKRLSERDPNVINAKGVDTLRWYVPLEIREWLIYVRKTWCLMMIKVTMKKTISKKTWSFPRDTSHAISGELD